MNKNRLEAFSDGVFAIAITVLILEIKIPTVSEPDLWPSLLAQVPKFISYVLSFLIIGVYWLAHHTWVSGLQRVDRNLLWLNIFNLLFVVFLPFPTAILGDYPYSQTALMLYASSLCLVNITGFFFWMYSTGSAVNDRPVSVGHRRFGAVMTLWPVAAYLVAMAASFVSLPLAYVFVVAVPLFYMIPNPLLGKIPSRYDTE